MGPAAGALLRGPMSGMPLSCEGGGKSADVSPRPDADVGLGAENDTAP